MIVLKLMTKTYSYLHNNKPIQFCQIQYFGPSYSHILLIHVFLHLSLIPKPFQPHHFIFEFTTLPQVLQIKQFSYSLVTIYTYSNFIGEMNKEVEINVDQVIKTLLDVRTAKPGKMVKITEQQILGLIKTAKTIFMEQPMLVEVTAPVKVCGDIHGQYYDMLRLFEYGGFPPESSYLFLGDYVDRGRQGIQTYCLLLALKIKYPSKITILRGNHESASITRIYGFYEQCRSRYNIKLWKSFVDCFNCMPVAAIIQDKILCMHGGLSPDLVVLDQINSIVRPTDIPDTGLLCDLLWADPQSSVKMWGESQRGVSFVFGQDVVSNFLHKNELDLICRAHQVVEDGYEFFGKKQLVTVFSAPNYCGEFNNSGAMMRIEEDLTCSFQVLRPEEKMGAFRNSRPKTPIKRGGS